MDAEALRWLGLDFEVLDSGCCGMAGSYGFEKSKYDSAMRCGERVLLPAYIAATTSSAPSLRITSIPVLFS